MSTPPWFGTDEPEFMPRVRRTFADQLTARMRTLRDACTVLAQEPGSAEAIEQIRATAHDLSGTAATVGAAEVGRLAIGITNTMREWSRDTPDADPPVSELTTRVAELEEAGREFLGWMEWKPA